VRVWNLATGGAVGDPFTGLHRLGDRAVAVAELDGRPVAVSGSDDRTTGGPPGQWLASVGCFESAG